MVVLIRWCWVTRSIINKTAAVRLKIASVVLGAMVLIALYGGDGVQLRVVAFGDSIVQGAIAFLSVGAMVIALYGGRWCSCRFENRSKISPK